MTFPERPDSDPELHDLYYPTLHTRDCPCPRCQQENALHDYAEAMRDRLTHLKQLRKDTR